MNLNIQILMPTHDHNPALFTFDALSLGIYTAMALPPDEGHTLGTMMVPGTYVHRARQELAELALKGGATHMLWLDSDMRVPREALVKLLNHDKQVVGINYSKRSVDADFTAIKHVPVDEKDIGLKCITRESSTGLEEVDAIGFGCVLMKAAAFNKLPDPKRKPWFWFDMVNGGNHVGEDVYFCDLLRKSGVKIYVDHDLSKECSHIGNFEYRCRHAENSLIHDGKLEAEAA